MIKFTESDLKEGYLVENPGWYEYKADTYVEKPAKTDGAPNHIWNFVGQNGEMTGVPVFKLISSKMRADLVVIMKAFNGGVNPAAGTEIEGKDTVGIVIEAMTKRGTDQNGKTINDLIDFRPVKR